MHNTTFDRIAQAIILVNGLVSYASNIILIYTILKYSKKHMGTYKHLMIVFVCFNMLYSAVHIVVMPNMHVHEYSFMIFPTSFFAGTLEPAHWSMVIYCSMFCGSLILVTYHFTYRYVLICRNHLMYIYNQARYIPLHFAVWLCATTSWGTALHLFMYHTELYKDEMRKALWDNYEVDLERTAILGPMYRNRNEEGIYVWHMNGVYGLLVCQGILSTSISVILFCSYRIHWTLKNSSMSAKTRKLQEELFRALIIQTVVPGFFEYIPCAVTFWTPMFHIPFGRFCNYVPIAISFYPIMDPICIIYFIKDYRYGLLGRWFTKANTAKIYSAGASNTRSTIESTTAA